MRRFRAFGLVFAAMLALSGIAAAAAFATYDSEVATTTLEGTQVTENVFTTNSGTVNCKSATFTGTQKGTAVGGGVFTSSELTVHPEYKECRAFGLAATVNTAGCNYKFTTAVNKTAPVHIECETGKEIVVNAGFGSCITKVGPQTPEGSVTFTDEGSGTTRSVLVTSNVKGIAYTQEGFTCTGGNLSATNGTYTGTVSTKGFSGTTQEGIWVT